jgi:hypothetical protein
VSYIDPTTGARVAVSTFGEWPEGSGVEARRVASDKAIVTDEAEIVYGKTDYGFWWISFPECGVGGLRNHTVTEHEDGTITVSPSIRMTGHKDGKPTERHGFLVRGRWHEV